MYIYYPELADRVLSGDATAFRRVLELSQTILPGEKREELALISSKFVVVNPHSFLTEQSDSPDCFGVDFMGIEFVDNPTAKLAERSKRVSALSGVHQKSLESTKRACLAILGGPP